MIPCKDIQASDSSFSSSSPSFDKDCTCPVLPKETDKNEHIAAPLQVVRLFLQKCAQREYEQAAMFLHNHVQVSYPGMPFIKSPREWYRHAESYATRSCGWTEAPQVVGCCPGQVIRRSASSARAGRGFIEVFQVNDVGSITAMYLRKAPTKWVIQSPTVPKSPRGHLRKRFSSFSPSSLNHQYHHYEERCDFSEDSSQERYSMEENRIRDEQRSFVLRKGRFSY